MYPVYRATVRWDRFRSTPDSFDLVITDMAMPGMSGIGLSQQLLAMRPKLPIIVCTGYSSMLSESNAEAMGTAACILKPILMRELAGTARKVLDRSKANASQ